MCEIDDSAEWEAIGSVLAAMSQCGIEIQPLQPDSKLFRAYLDGLIELPSETKKAIREMEREKAND